jgi:mannose/fructose/N-acetylgalactosamine-specific phosphotransferase system component IIB
MNFPLLRRKSRLVFPLVRVDDRLLHGQVIVGWGQTLQLCPVLLVSDRVSRDRSLSQTFHQLIPDEQKGEVISLTEAAQRWIRGDFKDTRAMLVVEAPVDALKLVRLGVPLKELILGGLHFREGRDEVLAYIYLSEWDRTTLQELMNLGVKIRCQDLPATKPIPYEE